MSSSIATPLLPPPCIRRKIEPRPPGWILQAFITATQMHQPSPAQQTWPLRGRFTFISLCALPALEPPNGRPGDYAKMAPTGSLFKCRLKHIPMQQASSRNVRRFHAIPCICKPAPSFHRHEATRSQTAASWRRITEAKPAKRRFANNNVVLYPDICCRGAFGRRRVLF